MRKKKIRIRVLSLILSLSVIVTAAFAARLSASAFSTNELKGKDGIGLGYSIINGYSKMSVKSGINSYKTSAVYSGLDVTNPYIFALAGTFYLANGVNVDKVMADNSYALELVGKLERFLKGFGVTNDRSKALKSSLEKSKIKITDAYETLGLFIINTDKSEAETLFENEYVDFVLAGAKVPPSMKDLNMDGKSDKNDIILIQKFLVDDFKPEDSDEWEYVKYAADINKDKKHNINDATALL